MQGLFPYLLNGISVGGQYALIAIGYTLVYGILRLINFAHGDVFMVAGLVEFDDLGDAVRDSALIRTANTETGAWDFVKVLSVE